MPPQPRIADPAHLFVNFLYASWEAGSGKVTSREHCLKKPIEDVESFLWFGGSVKVTWQTVEMSTLLNLTSSPMLQLVTSHNFSVGSLKGPQMVQLKNGHASARPTLPFNDQHNFARFISFKGLWRAQGSWRDTGPSDFVNHVLRPL